MRLFRHHSVCCFGTHRTENRQLVAAPSSVLLWSNLQVAERVWGPPLRLLERHSDAIAVEVARDRLLRSYLSCARTHSFIFRSGHLPVCPDPPLVLPRASLSVCGSRSAKQKVCMYVWMDVCMYACMYVCLSPQMCMCLCMFEAVERVCVYECM